MNARPVGEEPGSLRPFPVASIADEGPSRRDIPERHGSVAADREQTLPLGVERDGFDLARSVTQSRDFLAGSGLPDEDVRFVKGLAARHDSFAVGVEGDAENLVVVAPEGQDLRARAGVPHTHRVIRASRCETVPVRAERQVPDLILVSRQHAQLVAISGVSKADYARLIRGRDPPAVLGKCHKIAGDRLARNAIAGARKRNQHTPRLD